MKKTALVLLVLVGITLTSTIKAQTIDNAIKMHVYERYATAKSELEKLVAASPNNVAANYWLAQTLLQLGDFSGAQKAVNAGLAATNNNPMLQVANGQIDLFQGRKQEAKIKFESAITASDKKSVFGTLNAIGRANGTAGISKADPDYAIEKLNQAIAKEPKNPESYLNMGDVYRRKLDGGNAIVNYRKVLELSPNNAQAYYKIARVYQTQDNCPPMKEHFMKATQADPNYMAAWRELFDVHGDPESQCYNLADARSYLEKYQATTDQGLETDKVKMRFCYYSSDFNCTLSEIDKALAKYGDVDPDLYRFKGVVYRQLKDSINALNALETYIAKEKDASKINARVYQIMGELAAKIAGNESKVSNYYTKAIDLAPENKQKMQILSELASFYYKAKDYKNAALSYNKLVQMSETPSTVNLFYATISSYSAGMYQEGADVAKIYAEKYPTDFRGSFWAARNKAQIDSTGNLGLAIPDYEKFVPIAETEPEKNKKNLLEAYKYLFAFYSKSDKVKAQSYVDKIKAIEPTDADLSSFEAILSGKPNKPTPPPPPPPTKPVTQPTKPGVTPTKTTTPVKPGTTPSKPTAATNNTKTPIKTPAKTPVKTPTKTVTSTSTVKKS